MKKLFVIGLIVFSLLSCEKENPGTTNNEVFSYDYLQIGNYWIYEHFEIDTTGNEEKISETDSIVITRDTLINNNTYFIFEGTNYPYNRQWEIVRILRDSSGYLINNEGTILLAPNNFTDTLIKKVYAPVDDVILYTLTTKMEHVEEPVTVRAGTFKVFNYRSTICTPDVIPGIPNPRYMDNYYASGVGEILDTYFYLRGITKFEKRLIRYHIELKEL